MFILCIDLLKQGDFMENRSQKLPRRAILTEVERSYLRGKKAVKSKNKSKLLRKLNERFEALFKDLTVIQKSQLLDTWKSLGFKKWYYDLDLFSKIFNGAKPVHLSVIRHIKKGKKHLYWLDHSPHNQENPRIDEKSLKPEFVLRKLGTVSKETWGKKLVSLYLADKIPTNEKEAAEIKAMVEWSKEKKNIHVKHISINDLAKTDPKEAKKWKHIQRLTKRWNKTLERNGYEERIRQII